MRNEMTYIVIRKYGRCNVDYLCKLQNDVFGTTCTGNRNRAIATNDFDAARAMARKARRVCVGWNHTKGKPSRPYPRINFEVKAI
jgi:hypothetical protein